MDEVKRYLKTKNLLIKMAVITLVEKKINIECGGILCKITKAIRK